MEFPGTGLTFQDVTSVFVEASKEMSASQLVFMDGFTLQDAMSAYQVGEPQLDPGLVLDEEKNKPPFDPMAPMLPEEICWIIDRAIAYEMEWLNGNHLPHTLFTILYVHHLPQFDPIALGSTKLRSQDSARPIGLVTVVLRSVILSLLKCCDLAWRQLSRGGMQDAEDWQSEKCEVSMLEGVPAEYVVSTLDEAVIWLTNPTHANLPWRGALIARIRLRKTLLQLFNSNIFKDSGTVQALIDFAQYQIQLIRSASPSRPSQDSPASLVFDVNISRRLSTFVPVRIIPLPKAQKIWDSYIALLDGWTEVRKLAMTKHVTTWDIVANLQNWTSSSETRLPYLRAISQLAFFDGGQVFNAHNLAWMVDQFFFESLGMNFTRIATIMKECWRHAGLPNTFKMERELYKIIPLHIRAQWYNPPRRRRHFMKSLAAWHIVHDVTLTMIADLDTTVVDQAEASIINNLPNVISAWRLSILREVVLSGFQLELYAVEERPFAYWYTSIIVDTHLSCLDDLMRIAPLASVARKEMEFQSQFLTALGAISTACFIVTSSLVSGTQSWEQIRTNFFRRYKWAFSPEYGNLENDVICRPEMRHFLLACTKLYKNFSTTSPSHLIEFASVLLKQLVYSISTQATTGCVSENGQVSGPPSACGWADKWSPIRIEVVGALLRVCNESLAGLPSSATEMQDFDARKRLKWDVKAHPWFPCVLREEEEEECGGHPNS